jgi:sugar lactone lactonase YvrE
VKLKVIDLSSSESRALIQGTGNWNTTGLAWSQDGRTLLLSSTDANNRAYQLERVDIDNPQRVPLGSPVEYYLSSFTTAPGNSGVIMMAFPWAKGNRDNSRPAEIWLVDPSSGQHQTLRTDGSRVPESIASSPR